MRSLAIVVAVALALTPVVITGPTNMTGIVQTAAAAGGRGGGGGGGGRGGSGGGFNLSNDAPASRQTPPPSRPSPQPSSGSSYGNQNRGFNLSNDAPASRTYNNTNNTNASNRVNNTDANNRVNNTNVNNTNVNRNVNVNAYGYRGPVVANPVYRGPAWGWNHGVAWSPAPAYWGGGFWGAFAVGAASAIVMGSIVNAANHQTYQSYQVNPGSPGAQLLSNYHLQQVQCGPPNLVVIYGPNNGVICANPNDLVAPGNYAVNADTLTLQSP